MKTWLTMMCICTSTGVWAAALPTLECLVMGDSIAVGISQFSECHTASENSVTSAKWLSRYYYVLYYPAKAVFIALGTNDDYYPESIKTLRRIRVGVRSPKVAWLLPSSSRPGRKAVEEIAKEFGDEVFEGPKNSLGSDGIHYTALGYKTIASNLP